LCCCDGIPDTSALSLVHTIDLSGRISID